MENAPNTPTTPEHVRAENIKRMVKKIENLQGRHGEQFEQFMNLKNIPDDYENVLTLAFAEDKGGDIALAFAEYENEEDPKSDRAKEMLEELYQLLK